MLQGLFRRGAGRGWLVMQLEGISVRAVYVRHDGARPVVELAEKREWDPADARSLQAIGREFDAARLPCITLLKPSEYQLLLVEAPAVQRDELRAAVRWRIKDLLDYPVDEATLDVLELPAKGEAAQRARQMYAVAARRHTVRSTVERFANAGIELAAVDIPDTAQRNVAALFESQGRGVAALSFGDDGGLITVSFGAELYVSRHLDLTAQQLHDAEDVDDGDLVLEAEEGRARLFERVLVEMQRTLDHCERLYPFFSIERVLVGALPDTVPLREYLGANLYLPVEKLDLAQVVSLPASAAAWSAPAQSAWLKLIGAGLRPAGKIH